MGFKILKIICLFCLAVSSVFAGAWTKGKGVLFIVPYFYFYQAGGYYDTNWKFNPLQNNGYFDGLGFGTYFEYGFSNRLNLIGNFSFVRNRWIDDYSYKSNSDFGDFEVGLKLKIFESRFVLSFQTLAVVPAYSMEREPLIGYGEYAGEVRILFAGGLRPFSIDSYFNFELGYRRFYSKVAPQVRFQILYGVNLSGRWQGIFQIDGVNSIGQGTFSTRFNPSIETDYNEGKLSVSLAHRFTYKAWFQSGVFYDIYGRKIGAGRGFLIALWIDI